MTRYISPTFQINDADGKPIVGSKKYLFEPGTSTLKTIYSDAELTLPTENPVESNEFGEFPDIYLDGLYREVQHNNEGVLRWDSDVGSLAAGQFQLWTIADTYNIPDIVYGSDDEFYRSLTDSNVANNPTVSPAAWEVIKVIQVWNTNVTYILNQHVYGSDGTLYFSRLASNFGNDPTSNPDDWGSVAGNVPIVTAGSATAYTAIFGITAYETNRVYEVRIHTDNTGSATFDFDSLGAKDVKTLAGNDPSAGQLTGIVRLWYDGTNLVILDQFPGSVAGYVEGVTEYVEGDIGVDSTGFSFSGAIGASWENVGPTGSGADNIWTALDSVPSGTKWIEVRLPHLLGGSTNGDRYKSDLFARVTGSSYGATAPAIISALSFYNRSGSIEETANTTPIKIPVNSLIQFDLSRTTGGTSPSVSLVMYLIGWGL
jgi:hypothetical protein